MSHPSLATWLQPPDNRVAFRQVERVLPTAPIRRGRGAVRTFRHAPQNVERITYSTPDRNARIGDFLGRTFTDGLLVLRGETIVCESYFNGLTPSTRHILMSVSKAFAGMLAGILVSSDQLRLDQPVGTIVAELGPSAYGDASIQQILDMTASVRFTEEYDDPASEVQAQDRAAGWRPTRPGDAPNSKSFLGGLRRAGPHGKRFQYCSATTDVLAWVLERQSGLPYAELLADSIWSKIGAASDAIVTVDSAGFAFANAGVGATMADIARFGRLVLDDGAWNDRQVIPRDWITETRGGAGCPIDTAGKLDEIGLEYPDAAYHNQWWIPHDRHGVLFGIGIFGQYLWLDPVADVVIVKLSSWPAASEPWLVREHLIALEALAEGVAAD